MTKRKNNLGMAIAIMAFIVIFSALFIGLKVVKFEAFGGDNYIIKENFETNVIPASCTNSIQDAQGRSTYECSGADIYFRQEHNQGSNTQNIATAKDGNLKLFSSISTDFKLKNLSNYDWKFDFKTKLYGGASIDFILTDGIKSYVVYRTPDYSTWNNNEAELNFAVEIIHSFLNPKDVEIYVSGQKQGTFTFEKEDLQFEIEPFYTTTSDFRAISSLWFSIDNLRFRPQFSCDLSDNELLASETFTAREISIYSTRYPVKKFCLEHPVIVTSGTEKGSKPTTEPYRLLASGQVATIPQDQTWTIFYTLYNSGDIPAICGENAYDVNLKRCTNLTGFVYFCSEGTFSPELGSCLVTPESKLVCEVGRYDVIQGLCIWNPPIQYLCEKGDYNSQTGFCEYIPDSQNICTSGTYNQNTGYCEITPFKRIICEATYTYNPQTDRCEKAVTSQILCDGIYDSTTQKCIKQVETQIENICKKGKLTQTNGVYSCVLSPKEEVICSQGFNYDKTQDKCLKTPKSEVKCPENEQYDIAKDICVKQGISAPGFLPILLGIISFLTMIILVLVLMRKRR